MRHPQEIETLEFQDISELVRSLFFSSLILQKTKERRALWPWPSVATAWNPPSGTDDGRWGYCEAITMELWALWNFSSVAEGGLGVVNFLVEYYISPGGLKQILEKYRNQNTKFEIFNTKKRLFYGLQTLHGVYPLSRASCRLLNLILFSSFIFFAHLQLG